MLASAGGTLYFHRLNASWEEFFSYLFIIPILMTAFSYGRPGGLLTALIASLVSGSTIVGGREILASPLAQEVLFRIVFFNGVALITSILSERESAARYRYQGLFEGVPVGIFRADVHGRIVEHNPAMARMLGFEPGWLVDSFINTRFVDRSEYEQWRLDVSRGDGPHEKVVQLLCKDGTIVWGRILSRYLTSDGAPYFEGTIEDVTEQRAVNKALVDLNRDLEAQVEARAGDLVVKARELKIANDKLREVDVLKSTLLSTVSHDLRTPLTSIRGFARLVLRDFGKLFMPLATSSDMVEKGQRIDNNLKIIDQESERLTRLVNDFLDLSKIESGRMNWRDEIVDVRKLVRQAASALTTQLEDKTQVNLFLDIAPNLPLLIADPDRILQVLVNLMANALKFTDRGSVTVRARALDGNVFTIVEDTGPGIAPEDQVKIFDRFQQIVRNDTLSDKPQGTGLGLAICHEIMEHYGGAIRVESELGHGSIFTCIFPTECIYVDPSGDDASVSHRGAA